MFFREQIADEELAAAVSDDDQLQSVAVTRHFTRVGILVVCADRG